MTFDEALGGIPRELAAFAILRYLQEDGANITLKADRIPHWPKGKCIFPLSSLSGKFGIRRRRALPGR
jgi:hypothetical protein